MKSKIYYSSEVFLLLFLCYKYIYFFISLKIGNLTSFQRRVIVALITSDVHCRDIIEKLYVEGVQRLNDFGWQRQLRYYYEEESDSFLVKQMSAIITYGYEYMGATTRLVKNRAIEYTIYIFFNFK